MCRGYVVVTQEKRRRNDSTRNKNEGKESQIQIQ